MIDPQVQAKDIRSIGIIGAIASGKSTVSKWLAMRGWVVVDADQEVHRLYGSGQILVEPIVARFGPGILRADGAIDRVALGREVFGDPEKLKDLETITHPAARAAIQHRMEHLREAGGKAVLEMALLHRWSEMLGELDLVVGVFVPDETRIQRLMQRNSLEDADARRRVGLQDQDQLLAPAQLVLDNSADLPALYRNLEEWLGPLVG
ncbi:MAG: dephospho-CoA kinase [Fibrobacterota bacterium]|nr:dephospho-CoA kinase [Fibrobacterota bacterium]QQS06282.1 MAG: dephospho-CoA kinase [Fibrobacterota bacterium]